MMLGIVFEDTLELSWIKKIFPDVEFMKWSPNLAKESVLAYRNDAKSPVIVRGDKSSIEFAKLTQLYMKQKILFEVIHLSDEYGLDDLSWYDHQFLKKIYRNYITPRELHEFPAASIHKIYIFPLGPLILNTDYSAKHPSISDRHLMWSFAGRIETTSRQMMIEPYKKFSPHEIYFFPKFLDKMKKSSEEYKETLLKSKCIPILQGSNLETYRLYETLEFGAIPIYLRSDKNRLDDSLYFAFLRKLLPELKDIQSPDEIFGMSDEDKEVYRQSLMKSWQKAKQSPFVSLMDLANEIREGGSGIDDGL